MGIAVTAMIQYLILGLFVLAARAVEPSGRSAVEPIPEYIKQCSKSDPQLKTCLIDAVHYLRPWLVTGINEIDLPTVEPFQMDEVELSLAGASPEGYTIRLHDLAVRGASNYTVTDIKLGSPFEAVIRIPFLYIDALYSSSGVLILLRASGNGTFHAKLGNIRVLVRGTVSSQTNDYKTYLHVDTLDTKFAAKTAQMRVEKIFKNNPIITAAINALLQENGQLLLELMAPQLQKKLSKVFSNIVNKLLRHVAVETFLVP